MSTPEDLRALIAEGLAGDEIAERLGISRRTLTRRLSAEGLDLKHNRGRGGGRPAASGSPTTPKAARRVVREAEQAGETMVQTAARLGISRGTLSRHLRAHGVLWWFKGRPPGGSETTSE